MQNYICQDVLGLIYKQLPFHTKNMMLTCKYFYNTFKLVKKDYCVGNYILTANQINIIEDMIYHIEHPLGKSLIIQSNLSTGKTAACLAFALSKYKGTVVIIVPPSIIPQWHNEVIKMYDHLTTIYGKVGIVYDRYMDSQEMYACRRNDFNPAFNDYKVLIISHYARYDVKSLASHSVIMIDEVHKKQWGHNNSKIIGVTASKAVKWDNSIYKVYSQEEELPTIESHNLLITDINKSIKEIKQKAPGPYLILCSNKYKDEIKLDYIEYTRSVKSLSKMNHLQPHESALLCPEKDSTGINLTNIKTVIFVHPTKHINKTVIQAIGRATRVTSTHQQITLYNLHEKQEDIILHRSTLSENEIDQFCKDNELLTVKYLRPKHTIIFVIQKLIQQSSYALVYKIPPIYFSILARIVKRHFKIIINKFSNMLNLTTYEIKDILRPV